MSQPINVTGWTRPRGDRLAHAIGLTESEFMFTECETAVAPGRRACQRPPDDLFDFLHPGTGFWPPSFDLQMRYAVALDRRSSHGASPRPADPLFSPHISLPQPVANERRFVCNVLVGNLCNTGPIFAHLLHPLRGSSCAQTLMGSLPP